MGLFDFFKRSAPQNALQDQLRELGPVLFPGGHDEILQAGRRISALLDSRVPPDAAAKLYASTKYLAHTAADKSKARVVAYIRRQGMGRIDDEEASAIYDQFIAQSAKPRAATSATSTRLPSPPAQAPTDPLEMDDRLVDTTYVLQNSFRKTQVNAAIFTILIMTLRDRGWDRAASLFGYNTNVATPLHGAYRVPESDAQELAVRLHQIAVQAADNPDAREAVQALLSVAQYGEFTVLGIRPGFLNEVMNAPAPPQEPPQSERRLAASIASVIEAALQEPSIGFATFAKENCAVVLDQAGGVSLRWLSTQRPQEFAQIHAFALISRLPAFESFARAWTLRVESKGSSIGAWLRTEEGRVLTDQLAIQAVADLQRNASQ